MTLLYLWAIESTNASFSSLANCFINGELGTPNQSVLSLMILQVSFQPQPQTKTNIQMVVMFAVNFQICARCLSYVNVSTVKHQSCPAPQSSKKYVLSLFSSVHTLKNLLKHLWELISTYFTHSNEATRRGWLEEKGRRTSTSYCFSSTNMLSCSCMWGDLSQVFAVPLPHITLHWRLHSLLSTARSYLACISHPRQRIRGWQDFIWLNCQCWKCFALKNKD